MWHDIVKIAQDWAPVIVALAVGIVVVVLANRFLQQHHKKGGNSHTGILGPLMTFSLVGITAIATTLTLPIGEVARGQLLGLLGLLVTAAVALSSTTVLGNAMAGIMLRAIRHFRPGDFVRIGEHIGRVSEQGILHTEIQTEDRDLTTLPNLYLVTNPVTVLRSSGTVVSATISLGYDIAHQKIETLLCQAATNAGLSEPFVRVMELGDFSITYRAAGFLTDLKLLLTTRSNLRKAMLDTLHEAKIEIVSPTFMNTRERSSSAVVIPKPLSGTRKAPLVTESEPEARIFDKAEEAESRAKLQSELENQQDHIKELESKLGDSEFEAEKANLKEELATAKERKEVLVDIVLSEKVEAAKKE